MESPSTTPPLNTELQDFPELRRNAMEPKGVLQKNLKILLYLAAALLVDSGRCLQLCRKERRNR